MQGYVSINEASELTGKHKDTIRRLIKQNPKSQYIIKGRQGQYLISKDWLKDQYQINSEETIATEATQQDKQGIGDTTTTSEATGGMQGLYEALAKQLEAKDKQIDQLQQIILEKEANTTKLQDQFQKLLATQQLPAQTQTQDPISEVEPQENLKYSATVVEAKKPTPTKKVTKKQATPKPKTSKAKQKPKTTPKAKPQSPKKKWWQR